MKVFSELETKHREYTKKLKLRKVLNLTDVMDFEDVLFLNKVASYLDIARCFKAKGKEPVRSFLMGNTMLRPLKANKVEVFYGVGQDQSQSEPVGMSHMDSDEEGSLTRQGRPRQQFVVLRARQKDEQGHLERLGESPGTRTAGKGLSP